MKIQREFELAAEVQRSMLPDTVPTASGYSFWAWWQPWSHVGGDIYDFHTLPSGEIIMLVGDVAGKGLAAALGMASLAGMVPLALEQTGADLTRFASALNRSFFRWASRANMFATLLAAALDPVAHQLGVLSAGHGSGLIRRKDGTLEDLYPIEQTGLPLGVSGESSYEAVRFEMNPGDAVVITSDGVMNAVNATGEEYGIPRLKEVLACTEPHAGRLGEAVLAGVNAFTGGRQMEDDVVVVCFAREPDHL